MDSYSQIILNGCSFVKGYKQSGGTLGKQLKKLVDLPITNLSIHGSGNDRIIRTTYDFLEDNDIKNPLVVIGFSHWARFELYDKGNDSYVPFNFWDNHFDEMVKIILDDKDYELIDNEINHARRYGKKHWKKELLSQWDNETARNLIMFYLELFKDEDETRKFHYQQAKLLEAYIESKGGKLICFNSLSCLPKGNTLKNYFEFKGYNDWHTAVREIPDHLHPRFRGHPSTLSNIKMAEEIVKLI